MASVAVPKKVTLTYFDGRGLAETTRLALAYAGIEFEDKRVTFEDWPALKPNTPWGSLPTLEVDGKVLGQSLAISRYAAKLAGIAGSDALEAAKYDAIVDALQDCRQKLTKYFYQKDETEKAKLKKDMEDNVPTAVEKLAAVLGKDSFFGGSSISYADLHLLALVDQYADNKFDQLFTDNKAIAAVVQRVRDVPSLKTYLAARKPTSF